MEILPPNQPAVTTDNPSRVFFNFNALTLVEAAVLYGKLGFHVFPVAPNSKDPLPGWQWGRMHSRDEHTLRDWWRMHPDANIAMPCGLLNGVNVVDVDMKGGQDGRRSIKAITQEPFTGPLQTTPTGGAHMLFAYREGFRNFTHRGDFGGLDMRTDNGYIVVAPSRLPGGQYQWTQSGKIPAMPELLQIQCTNWSRASDTITVDAPDVPEELVDWRTLNLKEVYFDYLAMGNTSPWDNDESRAIFAVAGALTHKLNDPEQVFGIMCDNPFAWACAERHRQHGNPADWLWKYGIGKMVTKAAVPAATDLFGAPGTKAAPTTEEDPHSFEIHDMLPRPTIAPRPWLYGHRILRGYVTAIAAPGGVGKSMMMVADGVAMATGLPLLGEDPTPPLKVLYICNEDDLDELKRRALAVLIRHDIHEIPGTFRLRTGYGDTLKVYSTDDDQDDRERRLAEWVELCEPYDVVTLDPLISLHHGTSEKENDDMQLVMEALCHIAVEAQVGMSVPAHTRKGSQGAGSEAHAGEIDSLRGAGAVKDAARIAFTMARMAKGGPIAKQQSEQWWEQHGRHLVRLDHGKQNFSAQWSSEGWYKLESVQLPCELGAKPDTVGVPVPFDMEEVVEKAGMSEEECAEWIAFGVKLREVIRKGLQLDEFSCRKFCESDARLEFTKDDGVTPLSANAFEAKVRRACNLGLIRHRWAWNNRKNNEGKPGRSFWVLKDQPEVVQMGELCVDEPLPKNATDNSGSLF